LIHMASTSIQYLNSRYDFLLSSVGVLCWSVYHCRKKPGLTRQSRAKVQHHSTIMGSVWHWMVSW
jgi:hypothetical protein